MSERRDLLARPAQGLKWLRARLADLLTAVGGAIAALAGLVWTLAPWLVFAALAAGIAALISTDARVWLTTQATRGWALVAGEQAGPPGFLYIEAPQVYTRERLVNDRFTQANWLRTQLERTREESIIDSFSKPSEISQEFHRLALELRAADRNGPRVGGRNNDAHETDRMGIDVQMDRLDLFKKVNAYRDSLRSELMDVQLDDGHDLDGNTLYRLNFNAVVAPFHDQTRYPGSAVFLIRAKKPTPDHKHDQLTEDNIELLHQWQREMQAFLTQVLEQRLESFEQNSALENPTDPKEDLALDWFMRTRLVETFLTYLNDFPQQIGPHLKDKCDKRKSEFEAEAEGEETTDADKEARAPAIKALVQELLPEFVQELLPEFVQENIRNCRIDELSRLAGFAYRTDAPSPEMQPEQAAGFRRAIELAHLVNVAQWPKAGSGSYNARCANELKTEIEQDEAKAKENGSQRSNGDEEGKQEDDTETSERKGDTEQGEREYAPEQGNREGGNVAEEPEGSAVADIQEEGTRTGAKAEAKAPEAPPGGAGSGARQAFEIRVEQECLVPYEDPYRLRALSRLLSVTDDLGRRSRTMLAQGAESAAGTQNEDDIDGDPHNPFAIILRRFGEVLAKMEPGEGGRRTETMKKEDAQDAVAKILRRFGEVLPKMEPGEGDLNEAFTIADLEAEVDLPRVTTVTADGDPNEGFSIAELETKVNLPQVEPTNGDPSEGFTIADLETQMKLLLQTKGQLTDLARRCEPVPRGVGTVDAAIEYARCRFLYAPSLNVRGLLAEFIVARVNGDLGQFYEEKEPVLKDFLHVTTEGCLLTECRILVNLKTKDTKALASDLVTKLNDRTNGLSIYEISPRADKKVRHTGGGSDLSVWFAAPQGRASAETSRREEATDGETVVLGFGQPPAPVGTSPEDAEAVFGWTVRPLQRPDGGWSSSHHRFSAVISVPSWWKRLDLEIHACWIDPQAARANVEALFVTPPNICETVHGQDTQDRQENSTGDGQPAETQNEDTAEDVQAAEKKKEDTAENAQAADEKENAGRHVKAAKKRQDATAPWHFKRPVRVQLPRSIEEVTARFNFDLVKTPYFDYAWKRENESASNALMAGRPAHIALAGQRLWRGTVVTIDGQPADRITVLPDMKGVIAEFRCVRPTPSISSDKPDQAPATSSPAKLRVWTAEGRTNPVEVNVWPFAAENDNDTPCYIEQARAGATGDDE